MIFMNKNLKLREIVTFIVLEYLLLYMCLLLLFF